LKRDFAISRLELLVNTCNDLFVCHLPNTCSLTLTSDHS
jgi:hypothetical protein